LTTITLVVEKIKGVLNVSEALYVTVAIKDLGTSKTTKVFYSQP